MADRSVTVKLGLDIGSYLGNLKAAQAATRGFNDSGSSGSSKMSASMRQLGKDMGFVGDASDEVSKKVARNSEADRHSYSSTRGQVLAITALLTNLPAIVAPALGLLLAVPGAIATGGIAAITAGMAFKGFGGALKALDSHDVTKINTAMGELSPTMIGFAREVQGVREQWGNLRQSVQGATFAPMLGSMRELTDRVLPMLSEKLPAVGRAIGDVGAGFASWMGQSSTLGHLALLLDNVRNQVEHLVPFIQAWGSAFVNVSNVAGPFLAKLIDMLTGLGSRFDAFLTSARATGQLDMLFKTTAVGVQGLLDVLSKLAEALFTVLSSPGTLDAAKELVGIFMAIATVVDILANALTALPAPLQSVLLVMLALGGMGPLVAKGFGAVRVALVEVSGGAQKAVGALGNFRSGAAAAATETDRLTRAMGGVSNTERFSRAATAAGTATKTAAVGTGGFVAALGGPWGVAIAGAVVGLTLLMGAMGMNKQKADDARAAYVQFGEAVANARANGTDNVPELIKQSKAIQDLIIDTDRYGVSSRDMVDSLSGQKDATDRVIASLEAKKATLYEAAAAAGAESEATTGQYQKEIDGINKLEGEFRGIARARERAAEATALYNKAASDSSGIIGDGAARIQAMTALLGVMSDKTSSTADINKALGASIKSISDAAGPSATTIGALSGSIGIFNAVAITGKDRAQLYKTVITDINDVAAPLADKVNALSAAFWGAGAAELSAGQRADVVKQAWDALYKGAIDARDASEKWNKSLLDLDASVVANGTDLSEHTVKGLANRDAMEAAGQASVDMMIADIANGVALDVATAKHQKRIEKLRAESEHLHFAKDDTEALIKTYDHVPTKIETEIKITGVQAVMNQLTTLKIAQLALQMGMEIPAARREVQGQMSNNQAVGHAAGGPVHGPGTGTSDSVPAYGPGGARYKLSDGEHVWTAAEVKAAGGHDVILALRSLVMAGALKPMVAKPGDGSQGVAFARGGAVLSFPPPNWPFPVDVSHTKIPWTLAQIQEKWGWGPNWHGTIPPDVASAQGWIRAQAGKPYLWAEAGPWGYDCSGMVSAVWNILHGRNAYSHTFSTSDEAGYFPKPGWGMFTAGWANPGERGGGDVGHTAGWLAGLPFVSRGGDGVVVGSGAERVDSFAHVGHYDQGGYLQPGWNLAYNGTGALEPVGAQGGRINIVLHSDGSNAGRALISLLRPEIQGRFNGDVTRALGTK